MTDIEWARNRDGSKGKVWNPVLGCSRASAGCEHCYAERFAHRGLSERHRGLTVLGKHGPRWTGEVRTVPEALEAPLHWRKPQVVFVTSMSDQFHLSVPDEFLDDMFAVMTICSHHTFISLTKRAERMREYVSNPDRPYLVQRAIDRLEVNLAMVEITEEWRPVVGYEKYEVSNFGKVRRDGHELVQCDHSGGYKQVALCNGKPKTYLVHRIVLEAFDRPSRDHEECAHRNGIRTDNRIANLRWCTKDENMADSARQGTAGLWMKSRATLTLDEVDDIREARDSGQKLSVIAARFGITKQQVSAVALGKIFKRPELEFPPKNWVAGVSCENQEQADRRIPWILQTPAATRVVSLEPLLGPIDLTDVASEPDGEVRNNCLKIDTWEKPDWTGLRMKHLDGVIVGGESGPGARPCNVEWIRDIVRQCRELGTKCFVKQLGASVYGEGHEGIVNGRTCRWAKRDEETGLVSFDIHLQNRKGADMSEWSEDLRVRELPW